MSALLEEVRAELLALALPPRTFWRFDDASWSHAIERLGDHVAVAAVERGYTVDAPRAALLNWNAWLAPHVDKTAPYAPCVNGLVIFRHDTMGGALHVWSAGTDTIYLCDDGDVIVFDPRFKHEVTPITGAGYRASLLYYLPQGAAA